MKYLVLTWESLTNLVEGRALRIKTIVVVYKFLLEDVMCQYRCLGKIVADKGELNADEARELFDCLGVKISVTTAYNLKANGKIKRGHSTIVKQLLGLTLGRLEIGLNYCLMPFEQIRPHIAFFPPPRKILVFILLPK